MHDRGLWGGNCGRSQQGHGLPLRSLVALDLNAAAPLSGRPRAVHHARAGVCLACARSGLGARADLGTSSAAAGKGDVDLHGPREVLLRTGVVTRETGGWVLPP